MEGVLAPIACIMRQMQEALSDSGLGLRADRLQALGAQGWTGGRPKGRG